mmetsp:Transcript_160291/g.514315  ORF Transcript_160291/g.514315 Transcript_160291/m.514315 type:complete len:284 (+) Transcript_160291:73-924(+)
MGGGNSRQAEEPLELPQQQVVRGGGAGVLGVQHGAAAVRVPAAEHKTTAQVKIPLVWDKHGFQLERDPSAKHLWTLSAEFTAEVPCKFAAIFHCHEQVQGGLLGYSPAESQGPASMALDFPPGKHRVRLEGPHAIDLRKFPLEVFWKYKTKDADIIPIALSLFSGDVQSVVHLTLDTAAPPADLTCTLLKQKVFMGGKDYTLEDVYGLSELGKDGEHDESAMGQPCVICLTDPRNSAVMPCRHLCVCEDCALQLQANATLRSEKCPICRGKITGIQVFDVTKK